MILAPARWKLRNAIRMVNQALTDLKVVQYPEKTYIGRLTLGFIFLGYTTDATALTGITLLTIKQFVECPHSL